MAKNLKSDPRLLRLAADLGLRRGGDPIGAILRHCQKQVREFLREHPCATLGELLELAAVKLDVVFREIRSDEELIALRNDYCRRGELAFADLENQLSANVYAITFGLQTPRRGERKFVAVIDCRGPKRYRSYFSKWHEIAHLLTLTPQMRLRFCRTHVLPENKDPEESMMDIIAGEFTFMRDLVEPYAIGMPSFARFEQLRLRLAPEASWSSAAIGLAQAWAQPCILIRAEPGLKKRDRDQPYLDAVEQPERVLRAVKSRGNEAARAIGFMIPPNMRVPAHSVIADVFEGKVEQAIADEDLGWWESGGKKLPSTPVRVEARKQWDAVEALITIVG